MMLLDPRLWLVALALILGAYGTGRFQQWRSDDTAHVAAQLKASEAARQKEANWQSDAQVLEEVHADELRKIASQRDAAIAGLRNRPDRLPEAARAACQGATGAELSRDDGSAFIREAARADELRAALGTCQAWVETVTR